MIRCLKCMDICEMLEYHGIEIDSLEPQVQIVGFKNNDLKCDKCGEYLEPKEYYFDDEEDVEDFKAKYIDIAAEYLSEKIEYCSHCAGQDLEDCVNTINNNLDNGENEMSYEGMDAYDFLFDQDIPVRYRNDILEKLICNSCGHGGDTYHPKHNPDGGPFEINDRFYTKEEIDHFYGVNYDSLSLLGKQYGIFFSNDDFANFQEYLYSSPLLAYRHTTGTKIFSLLNKIFKDNQEVVWTIQDGAKVYRGRTRKKDIEKLTPDKLWNPPEGEASHGRYNSVGISVLYCCENKEGIPYEIHPKHDEMVDIGEFVVKKNLKLLDVSNLFEMFTGFFSEENVESKAVKKAYLLTNFIRDCCQVIGYHGVRYKGVGKGNYYNYAFFNFKAVDDIDIMANVSAIEYEIVYRRNESKFRNIGLD